MKRIYIFSILLLFAAKIPLNAQQNNQFNTLVMGVPQYLMINGIRLDIDKNIPGTKRWVVISPQLYNAKGNAVSDVFSNTDYLEVKGAGLGMSYKYIFGNQGNAEGVYLSAGGFYHYFDLMSDGLVWKPEDTGSMVLIQETDAVRSTINRFGIQSTIGIQSAITDDLFVDFYIGFGLKLSLANTENNGIARLSSFAGDYGYSGTHLVIGVRFGIGY